MVLSKMIVPKPMSETINASMSSLAPRKEILQGKIKNRIEGIKIANAELKFWQDELQKLEDEKNTYLLEIQAIAAEHVEQKA